MQVHCSNSDFYNKANFFPKNIKSLIINLVSSTDNCFHMFRRDKPFCKIFACSKLSEFTGTHFPSPI